MTSRADLILVAREKLADARLLMQHGRWSNAYYLYGYAVEIGLKGVIARSFRADEIPDRRFVESVYTHDLAKLVAAAGLEGLLERRMKDARFSRCWRTATRWKETARYRSVDEATARDLADAVDDSMDGVFAWLETLF